MDTVNSNELISLVSDSELTPLETSFCHFLVSDPAMDQTEAYIKVRPEMERNVAAVRASKILKKQHVKRFLGKLLLDRQRRLEVDEDWVITQLREIHDRCMQHTPVWDHKKKYEEDEETGETVLTEPSYYKFDAQGALKSLELIGKHMRMFSDKVDAGTMQLDININLGAKNEPIEGKFTRVGNGNKI